MAYLALYRRYRPTNFDGVVGQDSIVKTLVNQIMTDKIGHAYLFCGSRGVGKTTLAKIFAKSVNCLHPNNGNPCGECEGCKNIAESQDVNIIELDAASNNGVDSIRSIIDSVQFTPIGVKYKVYIIDEVHMLSQGAFNALLKTLEEPPKHVVFILATTEPHKIPETILSRCMRFDFKLVPTKQIANLIKKIYNEIGKKYDEEAINEIARCGEGSIRDALSIADLCVSVGESKLTYDDVLTVTGGTDSRQILGLVDKIFTEDASESIKIVDKILNEGRSVGLLTRDLINQIRDIAICKSCKNANEILELPEDRFNEVLAVAKKTDNHRIYRVMEILSKVEGDIRYSTSPRVILETAIIQSTLKEIDYNIDSLISRIAVLEEKISSGNLQVKVVDKLVEKVVEVPKVESKIETKIVQEEKKVEEKTCNVGRVEDNNYIEPEPIPPMEEESSFTINNNFNTNKVQNEIQNKPIEQKPIEQKQIEKIEIKEEVKQEQPIREQPIQENIKQDKQEEQKVFISKERVWGTLIRKMRSANPGFWYEIQNLTCEMDGTTLLIDCDGDNTRKSLIIDNIELMLPYITPFGVTNIKVVNKKEQINKKVEELQKFFDVTGKNNN